MHIRPFAARSLNAMAEHSLTELRLELLQKCTLACVHCSAESSPRATRSLETDTVKRIICEARELGVKSLIFTGGEPLLDPSLAEYIALAAQFRIRSTVFTSGFVRPRPKQRELITALVRSGLRQMNVSIYSFDANINAVITRNAGSLEYSQSALVEAAAQGIETELHFVPMAPNVDEFIGVAEWALRQDVSRMSVLRFVPQGRARLTRDTLQPAPTDELRVGRAIQEFQKRHPAFQIVAGPSFGFATSSVKTPCDAGFSSMSIRSDGFAFPCDAFKGLGDSNFLKGKQRLNIRSASLSAVWHACPYLCGARQFIEQHSDSAGPRCGEGCVSKHLYQETSCHLTAT